MAEKLDPNELASIAELILAQSIEQEAIINLLEKKGLIDKRNCWKK